MTFSDLKIWKCHFLLYLRRKSVLVTIRPQHRNYIKGGDYGVITGLLRGDNRDIPRPSPIGRRYDTPQFSLFDKQNIQF